MLKVGNVDRLPGGRLGRRVEQLEGHLSRGRDEEHAEVAPNDLNHEDAPIGQHRVPRLGLSLEALVADTRPLRCQLGPTTGRTHLGVLVCELSVAAVVGRHGPKVLVVGTTRVAGARLGL